MNPRAPGVPGMRRIARIHFVGIGGAGMCGIAEVLCNQGYRVSGSDASNSPTLARLRDAGVEVYVGHAAAQVEGADVVVSSSAVHEDNVEIAAARAHGLHAVGALLCAIDGSPGGGLEAVYLPVSRP